MRFRTVLASAIVAALTASIAPAHADTTEYFGTPIVDQRDNNGETGYVTLAWGGVPVGGVGRTTPPARPMSADCHFATEVSVDTSDITVDVVANATSGVFLNGTDTVHAASTGVVCTLTDSALPTHHSLTVTAAEAGAAVVKNGRKTISGWTSPITLCSEPDVTWSDHVHQVSATGASCVTK